MANLDEQWTKVRKILEEKIPSGSYNAWVLPLVPSELCDGKITLLTPHGFTAMTLKTSYGDVIAKALSEVFGENLNFEILQDEKLLEAYEKEQKKSKKSDRTQTENQFKESKYDGLKQMLSDCHLNTKYKFENFIVGGANKFAYGVSKGIAEGKSLGNPLFIYGGSGLGKTHLLHAIGYYAMTKRNKRVKYVTAEEFLNDLLEHLYLGGEKETFKKGAEKSKKMIKFRQKYRDVDYLLIDDIQFIAGKERTEEEMFNTFNTLYSAGKQIVITSDKPPAEIDHLSDRLKTRFEGGLLVDIGIPDLETRMAIVKQLVNTDGAIHLSLEVIEFLAQVYKNNIRELEKGFNNVNAYCSIFEKEPTLDVVKKAINYHDDKKQITADVVIDEVAKFYGLTVDDIKGSSRLGKIAYARKVAVYITRELLGSSWQFIGDSLGGRKHTTIMVSHKSIEDEKRISSKLCDEINTLFNIINQL